MVSGRFAVGGALLALVVAGDARGADTPAWLGEELPLPLTVKTPQDIVFKTAAERQYLIFNLMAGGKVAFQRGDYALAIEKWETLLKTPGLDPQIERAVNPALAEARRRMTHPPAPPPPASGASKGEPRPEAGPALAAGAPAATSASAPAPTPAAPADDRTTVSGVVTGGGAIGPGGAVIWLKRLDGPTPPARRALGRFITQRDKAFSPHVLAVPVGTSVEFRNEDRIYHNVFSLNKPNDFDGGIRAAGSSYVRTFEKAGPVEILCNIHSTMSAYIVVVDTPLYAKVGPSGTFTIRGVVPGRYEVTAWHEAASSLSRSEIVVPPQGARLSLVVNGNKGTSPFVPDKYGHKRQPQLGY
jgi:plastocyanin